MRVWWWVSGVALLAVAVSLGVFIATGGPGRLDTGDKVAGIASLVVGFASLVVALVALRQVARTTVDPAVALQRALEELARLVDHQWQREAGTRGLLHPEPLRVHWSSTQRPVAAPAAEVMDPLPGVRPTRLRLHGDVRTLADTWEQLPARQLVAIGPPGAGKTSLVVLLVRQLLARRQQGDPVPVLLSLAGWDPEKVHLETWLAQRLAVDYPQLGADMARRLVDRAHVIPVLDGLDEMPEGARGHAVSALTSAVADDRPLVLTCRADEYEAVIAETGAPLARAAVVELAPVAVSEIAAYLVSGQVDGRRRWAPVLDRLRAEPDGVLARTLSTPLMAYLARTAYAQPTTAPGDLLTCKDVPEIEDRLLDSFVPTCYREGSYRPEDAQRWLALLAGQMTRFGVRNLKPWSLKLTHGLSPRQVVRALLLMTVAAALLAGAVRISGHLGPIGLSFKMVFYFAVLPVLSTMLVSTLPGADKVRPARIQVRPLRVVLGSVAGMLVVVLLALLVAAGTLLLGVETGGSTDEGKIGAVFLLLLGAVGGGIAGGVARAVTDRDALDPASALRQDRTTALVVGLVPPIIGGLSYGLATNEAVSMPQGAMLGLLLGVAPAYAFAGGGAWSRWQWNRVWLWCGGALPWRSLEFLEDAHRRGVLRVVGLEYQFRHARLQDHLAGS